MRAFTAILSSFGALWLFVEVTAFFSEGTKIPDMIRAHWYIFTIVGLIIALCQSKPKLIVTCKLNDRDVTIEIVIGDMFEVPGALIIGSNTTFDTQISKKIISEHSIQGIFTKKYYSDETKLDLELSAYLNASQCQEFKNERIGEKKRYPIGTCVKLNPKQRTGYLLAIANINEHGIASGSFEDLKIALTKLWIFIGERGLKESIVIPVLGTGFTRLSQTREEIIREIIKSFIAACSEKTFVDKLSIIITPQDMIKNHISLSDLGAFLQHECRYSFFARSNQFVIGTPVT